MKKMSTRKFIGLILFGIVLSSCLLTVVLSFFTEKIVTSYEVLYLVVVISILTISEVRIKCDKKFIIIVEFMSYIFLITQIIVNMCMTKHTIDSLFLGLFIISVLFSKNILEEKSNEKST